MKLFERNLYKIIDEIEKYAHIEDIGIKNSEVSNSIPIPKSKYPKISKVKTLDLSKPNKFTITFIMGDTKDEL
jgi:hypothetical protein